MNERKHGPRSQEKQIKVGDLVPAKRLQWPLAVVTKINKGRDGLVRSVEVRR